MAGYFQKRENLCFDFAGKLLPPGSVRAAVRSAGGPAGAARGMFLGYERGITFCIYPESFHFDMP